MKHQIKPRKRMLLYSFFEKGYLFILMSLFFWMAYFYNFTNPYFTTRVMLYLIPLLAGIGVLMVVYEWVQTNYFLMKNYVFLKDLEGFTKLKYKDIRRVYTTAPVLQALLGTVNVCLETDSEKYYIKGIKDFRKIESKIIHNMHPDL